MAVVREVRVNGWQVAIRYNHLAGNELVQTIGNIVSPLDLVAYVTGVGSIGVE
jgi:hypothetical protein